MRRSTSARCSSAASIAAALGVATLGLNAAAQDRPTFRSATRLIEVSVVVTDRQGQPAAGLTADDFEILDEGKPQKVELFSVEASGAARPAAPRPSLPPREFSNEIADIGSATLILYDQLNTPDVVRMNVRQHLAGFLEQVRPDDRVGLYVLDDNGLLRVVHDFTRDAGSLVRAIATMRGGSSAALAAEADAAQIEADLAVLDEGEASSGARAMREYDLGRRAAFTIDALESIGRGLSGLQGRKNLIWVSSGFPLIAFDYRLKTKTLEIGRATRSLNEGNVALYTVDARGLIPGMVGARGKTVMTSLGTVQENQDILRSTAEGTGGRAFVNTNDIRGAIRAAADDARMTYLLGYSPTDDAWDGRFHRIEVKVRRPGLEVRHRHGYFAVPTERQARSQRTASLNAAVISPIDASNLGLKLRIDPVEGSAATYRVTVHVQPGAIALERRGAASIGAIDVVVAQVRNDGAEGRTLEKRVDVNVPDDRLATFQREGLRVDHTFTMDASATRLRVIVRDARTGAIGAIGVTRQQLQAITP